MSGLIHANAIDPPQEWRERVALIASQRRLTFGELSEEVRSFAAWLRENGCEPGDRIALCLPRGAEIIIASLAAMAAGAIYAPFDPTLPVERATQILELARPQRLITTERLAAGFRRDVPADSLPPITILPDDGDGHGLRPYAGRGSIDDVPFPDGIDTTATLLFTSGSTGLPKGTALSHRNLLSNTDWSCQAFGIGESDIIGLPSALSFAFTITPFCAPFRVGATLVVVDSMFADAVAETMERERVTAWFAVPTGLRMLVDGGVLAGRDLSSLRVIAYAGEVYPPQEMRKLMLALPGCAVINAFGQTETNTAIYYRHTEPPAADVLDLPIGHPAEHLEIRLVDEDGTEVGTDEIGQICVFGPSVMQGYWRDPERTAEVRFDGRADSYLSGDYARYDANGLLHYCGRRDRLVKIRGQRIELIEVEKALQSTAGVENSFVFVEKDETGVATGIIAVIEGVGTELEKAAAKRCVEALRPQARPRAIHRVDSFPRLPNGKIDRVRIVEMFDGGNAADQTPVT